MSNVDNSISFEIQERIGTIAVYPTGWSKELNLVGWYHLGVVIKHHTINP